MKQQCVLYISKNQQLLVFTQPNPRWSAMQVVKGALEPGETPFDAASRILKSETGLSLEHPVLLDSQIWEFSWEGETNLEQVHYVWFQATPETPDAWTIKGSSNEFDQPRTYQHKFVPLEEVKLEWEMALGLPKLLEALTARTRVLAYITRNRAEILVFKHDASYPDAGVQVPGGGLEPNETLALGIMREVLEETGLNLTGTPVFLGARVRQSSQYGPQFEHYFWLEVNPATPDAWTHNVSAGELDNGMKFHHEFVPLEAPGIDWDMEWFIPKLLEILKCRDVSVNYITRKNEILIFEGHPWGGIQVVAGGVDNGETPTQAAIREALEEAGLNLEHPKFLGTQEWHGKSGDTEFHEFRHYFQFVVTETRDSWEHVVSAGEVDVGFVFKYKFVKLEDAHLDYELDKFLAALKGLNQ